jgi:Papain family cysteine protease
MWRLLVVAAGVLPVAGCSIGRAAPAGGDAGPAVVAPREVGAAHVPPPLRAHAVVPPLPDLPSLDQHEPSPTPPSGAPVVSGHCGGVWTGTEVARLACFTSSVLFGTGANGATELLPDKVLARDPSTLPRVVDHRLEGTEGPVRSQGLTPACTAFAMAAAIDHAVARWTGKGTKVAVMEIWSRYHTPLEGTSISSNLGLDLGSEADWPFSVPEANSWVPCDAADHGAPGGCGKPVGDTHARLVATRPVAGFTRVEYLGAPDSDTIRAHVAAGQDVVLTMRLSKTFATAGRPGARYVPNYTKSAGDDAGHALVIAGYATLPHGTYFLLHNSWGLGWGDGGYAWIHEATVKAWGNETLVLDAEPESPSERARPQRKRGETTCEAALVPDSILGSCAPACADGSPRHADVCPVTGQCPPGFVNLTGACVLAAPSGSGKDAATGIAWTCGAGGCSYTVPRAADPACTGALCKVSCPAPDFRLAREQGALTCIE